MSENLQSTKDPFDYILPNHISIGSSLGKELEAPEGSGILIKFLTPINGVPTQIYGILTASHVIEKINLIFNKKINGVFIGLSKPTDRFGGTFAITHSIEFIYHIIDKSYCRKIMQNHKIDDKYENERDIAFICLSVGKVLAANDLFANSDFFDLDTNPVLDLPKKHDYPFVFFKGACNDNQVQNKILNTELIIETGGTIKKYPKSKILYHEIQNTKQRSLNGASGAGLWMFHLNTDNQVTKTLKGVLVETKEDNILAIDISYINEIFLPSLKEEISRG
jgi:hypothetical protein